MIEHGNVIGGYEVQAKQSLKLQDKFGLFGEDVVIMQNLYCKRTARMKMISIKTKNRKGRK